MSLLPKLEPHCYFSHLASFSPLCDSSFIHHSLLCSLSSFFYLPVVESLPNEVADGSILLRDRVERLPTLKSINLTVSISTQTSPSTLFKTTPPPPQLCATAVTLLVPVSLRSQITHGVYGCCCHLCIKLFKYYFKDLMTSKRKSLATEEQRTIDFSVYI